MQKGKNSQVRYFDIRLKLFQSFKRLLLLLTILLFIKFSLFDTYKIATDIASPFLEKGDRVLISKLTSHLPFRLLFKQNYGKRVIMKYPASDKISVLRVAGKSGDTVSFVNTQLTLSSDKDSSIVNLFPACARESYLSNEYSPRDNMQSLYIPKKGDTLFIPELGTRDIIYSLSIIKQENPKDKYSLKRELLIDDTVKNDYLIKDFFRYTGKFENIPDSLSKDRFFWEGLIKYLNKNIEDAIPYVSFEIIKNGSERVTRYIIKENSCFLLSENYDKGLDSRYIGYISQKNILGRAILILWSTEKKEGKLFPKLKLNRFLKILGKKK